MITSPSRPARTRRGARLVPSAAVVCLALAACGGGDDDSAGTDSDVTIAPVASSDGETSDTGSSDSTTPETTVGEEASTTSAPEAMGGADDFEPGGEVFRVVNLTAEPVDVYVRTTGLLTGYEIQPGLAPGDITDFFAPPQDGSVIITAEGAGDPTCVSGCDHIIADVSVWDDTGDTFTVLLHDADGEPAAYDLWEETGANTTSANAMVAADPATGQFVAIGIDVADDEFGMRVGLEGVEGCVEPSNLTGGILVGGNQTPAYVYDGDSAEVLLFDNQDQDCTGEPVGGPFTVSGGPGTRTFLFLTGTPGALDAIVLAFGADTGSGSSSSAEGSTDDAGAGDESATEVPVEGTDDVIEYLTQQLIADLGMPEADAQCLSVYFVTQHDDLFVIEDGILLEPPDTPETQDRLLEAMNLGAAECGVEF